MHITSVDNSNDHAVVDVNALEKVTGTDRITPLHEPTWGNGIASGEDRCMRLLGNVRGVEIPHAQAGHRKYILLAWNATMTQGLAAIENKAHALATESTGMLPQLREKGREVVSRPTTTLLRSKHQLSKLATKGQVQPRETSLVVVLRPPVEYEPVGMLGMRNREPACNQGLAPDDWNVLARPKHRGACRKKSGT